MKPVKRKKTHNERKLLLRFCGRKIAKVLCSLMRFLQVSASSSVIKISACNQCYWEKLKVLMCYVFES